MAETSDDELLQIDNCIDTWSLKMASASDFQRLHNALSTNLTKINANTNDLESLVQKLGTSEDSEPLRERYLRLQNDTKGLMQQINGDLKKLETMPVGSDDQRKKKSLIENFSKQYLAIVNRFQEAQRTGARKEKESLERARAVTYYQNNVHESQAPDSSIFSNSQTQQQVVLPMEQDVGLKELRERDDQLRQLESNIVQVNELFKDVSRLVSDHGEIIDSIEKNIDNTQQNVQVGTEKLGQAVKHQTAARRKKIILCVILIIIVAIIGLILAIYFGTK